MIGTIFRKDRPDRANRVACDTPRESQTTVMNRIIELTCHAIKTGSTVSVPFTKTRRCIYGVMSATVCASDACITTA